MLICKQKCYLSQVSWRNWDQNEAVNQFAGAHALLSDGCVELIDRLAEGLDIRYDHEVRDLSASPDSEELVLSVKVTSVEWPRTKKSVTVLCRNGKKFSADKVRISVQMT